MSNITITVNGEKVAGNTRLPVLEQLENAGLMPEYQCRNGVCGACRCKLKNGKVLSQDAMAWLDDGEILGCQSIPTGNIDIEFDYQVSFVAEKAANL